MSYTRKTRLTSPALLCADLPLYDAAVIVLREKSSTVDTPAHLERIARLIGTIGQGKRLRSISKNDVQLYISARQTENANPLEITKELNILCSFQRYCRPE